MTRILLVEDSATQAQVVAATLEQTEFELESTDHLAEAVDRIQAAPYGAVILDLTLPDSDGLDTYLRMQDACPATPIVVLTSTDDEDLALRLLRSGAQDYLVKSEVTSRWIIRALRNAVGRSSASQSRRKREPELDREFGMKIEQIGDVTVLRIQETQLFGDRLLEQLSSQMFKLVDEGGNRKLVLNCDRVEYVSNSVLTRLVMWDEKIRQHGGSLRVCNLRRDIQDQIKARRLLSQLNICIDEETALRFF